MDGMEKDFNIPKDYSAKGYLKILIHLSAGYQYREEKIIDHLNRLAAYVKILSKAMLKDDAKIELLKHASVFHDVGMIYIPDEIIRKQGSLNSKEFENVKLHTKLGWTLLTGSNMQLLNLGANLALYHHEYFDGTGYPQGIKGKNIPLEARILAAVDVLDALTVRKSFKDAYPFDFALDVVRSMAGKKLDPEMVDLIMEKQSELKEAGRTLLDTGRATPSKGFLISDRDQSNTGFFSITKEGYFSCPFCLKMHPRSFDRCPAANHPVRDIHKLSGLKLENKYLLKGAIGVGGMGTVYEAEHIILGRMCAIKFLDPGLVLDEEALTRFYNEARIFSKVMHSNIVDITDIGKTSDGIPYLVMELLKGDDLGNIIFKKNRLEPIVSVIIVMEILRTLSVVHRKGIIHRDLKPENIFLAREDDQIRVKILDFGISRIINFKHKPERITQKGMVVGTVQYMSPEQASGQENIDERSDLFTVGEIMYKMLTGEDAFKGDNDLAVVSAVCSGKYMPPSQIVPEIPEELEKIIEKAFQLLPSKRFQNAEEFMEALLTFAGKDKRFEEHEIDEHLKQAAVEEESGKSAQKDQTDGYLANQGIPVKI
jgi:serine/threonine-protein kinase